MYRFFLALRFLLSRRINLLGVIGIMLGVWALIVVVSVFSGVLEEVSKHLQGSTADLTVTRIMPRASFAKLEAQIEADPNVAACAPRVIWKGLVHPFGDGEQRRQKPLSMHELGTTTPFVSLLGIDPAREREVTGIREWMTGIESAAHRVADPDDPLAEIDGDPAIILSRQRMEQDGAHRGQPAKVTIGELEYKHGEQVLDFPDRTYRVAGAYQSRYAFFDGLHVFVDIDELRNQRGTARGGDWVNEIAVKLVDTAQADETAARLRRLLGTRDLAGTSVRVETWSEANSMRLGSIVHQRALMKLVLFVILVVAAFLMFATLSMMVLEKRHDIGILTAMGASTRGVAGLFFWCGASIAIVGVALGILTGCLSAIYLDAFNSFVLDNFGVDLFPVRVYNLHRVPYSLDPWWILQVAGWALLVGTLVSVLPAWRAARHDPLVSLRNE